MSWSDEVNGRHSSPYSCMDSIADQQRPILIASFAFEMAIEQSLVVADLALSKRNRKTVCAMEVGTPMYSNLSQLSTESPFAKRTYQMEACPRCSSLVLLWLIVSPISAAELSSR